MKISYLYLFLFVIVSCKKTEKQLVKITAKNIAIDSTIKASEQIDSIISPYKNKLTSEMEEVLCFSPKEIVKNDGEMQSSLGNLMADMCFEVANPIFKEKTNKSIDFVLFNNGGIRANIPAGAITAEHAFKLMPFENELVVVALTSKKVSELIAFFIKNKKAHPVSKNIVLTLFTDDYNLKINGKAFNQNKTYNVLTNDYLRSGGDKMNFFKNANQSINLDYKMRDAILDYFKKTDTLKASIDNRIILK
ncbi:UDP-sugar hydrolase [Polaribacter sp. ALD11]|uniref:5'-nucleotidase C-terminal domain-containing protein n=1 Tax=Polaribacter sp. ALD11 TaxID=2058137 RepID=UPI000C31AC51|nr:5'-nucleotidase [Polaribacter sp. ALD11]AUC84271.1 UDP-sugar hydrolase [Polaribacter sp. ALD11]